MFQTKMCCFTTELLEIFMFQLTWGPQITQPTVGHLKLMNLKMH